VFLTWKGDHGPRHGHVYRDGGFNLEWDLSSTITMQLARNVFAEREPEDDVG
jgi:hypothetical protein